MRPLGRHGSKLLCTRISWRAGLLISPKPSIHAPLSRRCIGSKSHQQCLSDYWTPTTGTAANNADSANSLTLLTQAGFIRQSNSGIFHLLPLGLRVQSKIEALVDKHMRSLGASKVSLSSVTSEALWKKSGRFSSDGKGQPELYRLRDGTNSNSGGNRLLLAPTHEEEITKLVAGTIQSYKELPLRLYQISRKYRNELRPRQGLLRAREFLMKDLYTFDLDRHRALKTYEEVRAAYAAFFDELKIPYLTAEADSGNMGGDLSHEYHFVTDAGEDNVVSCDSCGYVSNEEKAVSRSVPFREHPKEKAQPWVCVTEGGRDLVIALIPATEGGPRSPSWHALKRIIPDVVQDVADPVKAWATYQTSNHDEPKQSTRHLYIVPDFRIDPAQVPQDTKEALAMIGWPARGHELPLYRGPAPQATNITHVTEDDSIGQPVNLLSIVAGDRCSKCDKGTLNVDRAVELGHTFHLGTRYSEPLDCTIGLPGDDPRYNQIAGQQVPLEMGCHGIGVSRLIGAVAHILADDTGLNWPRVIAPFEAVIITADGFEKEGKKLYNVLTNRGIDVVLDDRQHKSMVWKMHDADTVGYPVILLVTKRSWGDHHSAEVQCRRSQYKKNHRTEEEDLGSVVAGLLEAL